MVNCMENTTVSYEEWKQLSASVDTVDKTINYDDVELLSPYITSYMTSPVGLYDGEALVAMSIGYDDINAIIDHFKDKTVFLYTCFYTPYQDETGTHRRNIVRFAVL